MMDCDQSADSPFDEKGGGLSENSHDGSVRSESGQIVPVILSGGSGTRLWPYSTEERPKQFLSFTGEASLFRLTLDRVRDCKRFSTPVVVASERHLGLCESEFLAGEPRPHLILEPCGRNTAPAIALAAIAAQERFGAKALLLIMPSDHVIDDVEAFHIAVAAGEAAARRGRLVTFGITPTGPETGFGYIEAGEEVAGAAAAKSVLRFIEKPQPAAAEAMAADGRHFWNAGIFLFRADIFLEELALHAADILESARQAIGRAKGTGDTLVADLACFAECRSESIDYAVLEHSSRVAVVPMSPGWSDLGSWDALASLPSGPALVGPVTAIDCDGCFIRSDGLHVAAFGIRDLIVVASGQKLLILPRGRSQEVKKLLSMMESVAA